MHAERPLMYELYLPSSFHVQLCINLQMWSQYNYMHCSVYNLALLFSFKAEQRFAVSVEPAATLLALGEREKNVAFFSLVTATPASNFKAKHGMLVPGEQAYSGKSVDEP